MKQWIKNNVLERIWTTVFANPVVVRDLRAQMRGTKSYWFQGAYLLLLGLLAIAGYAMATQQTSPDAAAHVNIVDAQNQMQQLYYCIFGAIAAMILLVAPALTASSIVGERQRLSFDLLVTTPLPSSELLVGKLISSIAFLGFLLSLSLPAAALCVLLGGAAITDVFRVYVQLAIDGTVLAAVGLFFSCAARTNLLAVIWSYLSVAAAGVISLELTAGGSMSDPLRMSPLLAFGALNPISAIELNAQPALHVGPFSLPSLLVSAVFALLIVRLLITASTYRLGTFGVRCIASLRRQTLLLSAIGSYLVVAVIVAFRNGKPNEGMDAGANAAHGYLFALGMVVVWGFMLAIPFLPALFVPVSPGEDLPGSLHRQDRPERSVYRPGQALLPIHAGAQPFFHLWLLCIAAPVLIVGLTSRADIAAYVTYGAIVQTVCLATLYVAAAGFLLWQISRFSAALVQTLAGARGLSFGIFAILSAIPLMIGALMNSPDFWESNHIAHLFIFFPTIASEPIANLTSANLTSAFLASAYLSTTFILVGYAFCFGLLRRAAVAFQARRSDSAATALAQASAAAA